MTRALGSLTNRIFLASTLLATVSIGAAVYFVSTRLRTEAEADLERDLIEAGNLVEQQRASLLGSFMLTARLIADLPTLKAALDTRDAPTVEPICPACAARSAARQRSPTGLTPVASCRRSACRSRLAPSCLAH